MTIGLVNKGYINVAKIAINEKEASSTIAFGFSISLKDYL